MSHLGKRIRMLRKKLGLTQSELARGELTKSMLSQIENGHAMPSMKSLTHIASALGCEPAYLLEEAEDASISDLLRDMENYEQDKAFEKMYDTLLPIVNHGITMTVDGARVLEYFAKSCMHLDHKGAKDFLERAAVIYERYSLYQESAKAKLLFVIELIHTWKFKEIIELLYKIRKYYKGKQIQHDVLLELQMFHYEAIALLALGEYEKGKEVLLQAISFSQKHEIYYKMDDFYRITASQAMLNVDKASYLHYMHKARQYAIFTESDHALAKLELLQALYHNQITQEYKKALHHASQYRKHSNEKDGAYFIEVGKALYGLGHIEQALRALQKATIPSDLFHPLDHAWIHTAGSYRALCYDKLGMKEIALREAKLACEAVATFPTSYFSLFISETFRLLYVKYGNIEETKHLET